MKHCPVCKTSYTDDSLSFCLSDGNPLVASETEQPTVVRSAGTEPKTTIATAASGPGSVPGRTSGLWLKLVFAVVILGVAALAIVGFAGAFFYYKMGSAPDPAPTPRTNATPSPDIEKERLKDEIANIRRKLEETANTNSAGPDSDIDPGSPITATVDSPNDGFLALRDRPDAERGERLAKIPHGAEVEIMNCEKTAVTIGGRNGRWCQVEYDGLNGWVFDAWLEY